MRLTSVSHRHKQAWQIVSWGDNKHALAALDHMDGARLHRSLCAEASAIAAKSISPLSRHHKQMGTDQLGAKGYMGNTTGRKWMLARPQTKCSSACVCIIPRSLKCARQNYTNFPCVDIPYQIYETAREWSAEPARRLLKLGKIAAFPDNPTCAVRCL